MNAGVLLEGQVEEEELAGDHLHVVLDHPYLGGDQEELLDTRGCSQEST